MEFRIAFGIFEADVEIPGEYAPDTEEFEEEIVRRLKKGGIKVKNVDAF